MITELTIEISNQCDKKCNFCSNNSLNSGELLDKRYIFDLIRSKHFKDATINISGGEPMYHRGIIDIIKMLETRDGANDFYIYTASPNLIYNLCDFWNMRYYKYLNFVLNGNISTNDHIISLKEKGLNVSVNFCLTRDIVETLEDRIKLLSPMINRIKILRLINQGRAFKYWGKIYPGPLDCILPILKDINNRYNNVKIGKGFFGGYGCDVGRKLVIMHDGNAIACEALKDSQFHYLGNIKDDSLDKIVKIATNAKHERECQFLVD